MKTVTGKPGEVAEDQTEDDDADERLEDRPRDPENRLLVANLEALDGENQAELAERPELADFGRGLVHSFIDDADHVSASASRSARTNR